MGKGVGQLDRTSTEKIDYCWSSLHDSDDGRCNGYFECGDGNTKVVLFGKSGEETTTADVLTHLYGTPTVV